MWLGSVPMGASSGAVRALVACNWGYWVSQQISKEQQGIFHSQACWMACILLYLISLIRLLITAKEETFQKVLNIYGSDAEKDVSVVL